MRIVSVTVLCLLAVVLSADAQTRSRPRATASTAAGITGTPALKARIWRGKEDADVTLVGFSEGKVHTRSSERATTAVASIDVGTITRTKFELNVDMNELSAAIRKRDWAKAIGLYRPDYERTKYYLHLPENNAAELAYQMGTQMMRAAARLERRVETEEHREILKKRYKMAYDVFVECAKVTWSSIAVQSQLKGCRCLLSMGKPKTCNYYLEQVGEPMPGDAAYGLFWLVQGESKAAAGDFTKALDAAVRSVTFENKDIETFPDALMLSSRCYEELREWYRARDVYFEVVSIFPRTDWADDAMARLQFVLDEGLTEEKETSPIENVFFGLDEDINELARELLAKRRQENGGANTTGTVDGPPDE